MKVTIEFDSESVHGTRVSVDGVDISSSCRSAEFWQKAGDFPQFVIERFRLDENGNNVIDPETWGLATETIRSLPVLKVPSPA